MLIAVSGKKSYIVKKAQEMILLIESNNEQIIRLMAELAAAFQARVQIQGLDEVPAEVRAHRVTLGSRFKGGLRSASAYQPDPTEWYEQ